MTSARRVRAIASDRRREQCGRDSANDRGGGGANSPQIRFYAIGAGINGIAPAPVFDPGPETVYRHVRQHPVSKPAG